MSDQQDEERERGRRWAWVAFFLAMMLVSYPLSLGPVMYAVGHGWVSLEFGMWLLTVPYGPAWDFANEEIDGGWLSRAYFEYLSWFGFFDIF